MMKKITATTFLWFILVCITVLMVWVSKAEAQPCLNVPFVIDVDSNVYNTVQIGNQCWMRENLRTTHYSDGTEINLGVSANATIAYRYAPYNNESYVSIYGYLYNWPAVMHGANSSNSNPSGVQGVCPNGWHVPSDAEWVQMKEYLSSQNEYVCGIDSSYVAKALSATTDWQISDVECAVGNGTEINNSTSFSAFPAGIYTGANFGEGRYLACFYTTSMLSFYAKAYEILYDKPTLDVYGFYKSYASSVRCVYDAPNYSEIIFVTPTGAGTHSGDSWANATSSIEDAQALAQANNAVVWVAAGTYYGDTLSENAFTMRDGVSVYGGFAGNEPADYDLSLRDFETNATILDGQNARRVLYNPYFYSDTTTTIWDGFVIQNGNATYGYGGGAYLWNAYVVLSHCKVTNCTANKGGGVYAHGATVTCCEVIDNISNGYMCSGGGIYAESSTISDCKIVDNIAGYGGGIYSNNTKIHKCQIYNNLASESDGGVGGGVYAENFVIISKSQISFNTGSSGGGIFMQNGSALSNSLVSNNTSYSNGGVWLYQEDVNYSPSVIVNTTIVRNEAEFSAGVGSLGENFMINSVVWGNNGKSGLIMYELPQCLYSAVEDEYLGATNIPLMNNSLFQPLFVNPSRIAGTSDSTENVDWHLQSRSILINRGSNNIVEELNMLDAGLVELFTYHFWDGNEETIVVDSTVITNSDLDGIMRIQQDTIDIGCYESNNTGIMIPTANYTDIIYVTPTGSGSQNGDSWSNASSSIQYANLMAAMNNISQVWVAAGTYYGDTTVANAFTMHDGVNVIGGFSGNESEDYDLSLRDFDSNSTILDGQNARRVLCQPSGFNDTTVWDGFSICNGYATYEGGGAFLQTKGSLNNCRIFSNITEWGGGGLYAVYAMINKCLIFNNTSLSFGQYGGYGGGVLSGYSTITNCLIANNTAASGDGSIGGGICGIGTVINSTIVNNRSDIGSAAGNDDYDPLFIINSIVFGNVTSDGTLDNFSGNISCSYSAIEGGYAGDGNISLSAENPPLFVNPSLTAGTSDTTANVDWHLQNGSPCINRGNNEAVTDSLDLDGTARIKRDTVDMGCYESDYYDIEPFDTVQCQIVLELGRQYPDWNANDNTPWIEVYQGNNEYPIYAYYYMAGTAGTKVVVIPVLSGVPLHFVWYEVDTVSRNSWCTIYSPSGDVVFEKRKFEYVEDGIVLTYTSYCDNTDSGGVVYVTPTGTGTGNSWDNALSSIKTATIIALNSGADVWVAAGTYYGDIRPTSEDAFMMLEGVDVYGGFAGNEPADFNLSQRNIGTNKTVLDGQNIRRVLNSRHFTKATLWDGFTIQHGRSYTGAGVCLFTNAKINHCEIIYNYSITGGGGGVYADHGTVSNCLIANNTANWGGGLAVLYSSVNNSTIVRNSTDYTGVYGDGYSTLTNTIVWGNTTSDGTPRNLSGNITCSYSAIEGGYAGDGNISLSAENPPLFVNPSLTAGTSDTTANVDWHLQNGSPCINRGNNEAVTDSLDLDGTARIKRDTVDMGCYESDFYSVPVLYCTTVYSEFAETACESYTWNDQVYSRSGDYQQTFPLANGCDSIVTLHLTVNHSITTHEYLTTCASDLPYAYRDTLLDVSTPQLITINSHLLTQNGCDSTVVLHLTVLPSTVGDFAVMTPTDNYPLTNYPIHFTWDAVENASGYELYVWPVGEPQPQQPTAANIYGTSYVLHSLPNRSNYQWIMKAYNACDTSVSSIRQFSLNVTPSLTVNANNPIDFGEVQLNSARSIFFQVNGTALDSAITYQLTGADTAAFSLAPTNTWDSMSGGRMQLTFHPQTLQNEFIAQMTIQSNDLVRTFTVKGYLADFLTFTTYVDSNVYAMDSNIPIHGQVINALNEPVSGLDVEVYVKVMDYTRTYPATSDANGQFTITFTPQHSEAGYYTVGSRRLGGSSTAVHDDFNIPGMMLASSDWILWEPTIGQADSGTIAVRNRSQIPLTNIQVTPVSLPNGCTVQFAPLSLAGLATGELQYTVSGSQVSTGVNYEEVRLNAVSNEGAGMSFTAWYYCLPQRADLDVTPTSLTTTMTRGKSKVVDFKIYNNGTGPTGNIFVSLPNVPWMSVVGSDTLPSLAVHDSAYVSIRLSADSTTALVRYTGNLAINCERGEGVSIPYDITAISDSTGTLVVDVTDEYTWNTNNGHGPHLAGANVTVKGYYSLETEATGITDSNGLFTVNDLPEGYYKLIVRADRHEEYQGVLEIVAGDTNRQDIFIQFQAITYSWDVVPTEIQDEYTYELNVEFETHVPAPVVTMDIDRQLPLLEGCDSYVFNLIVTNHGLVAALDYSVIVPNNPYYTFTPLISQIDTFPAQTTFTIPVTMRRTDCVDDITGDILPQPTGANPVYPDADAFYDGLKCLKTVFMGQYRYHCDVDRWVLVYSKLVAFNIEVDPINCLPTLTDISVPWRPYGSFPGPTELFAIPNGGGSYPSTQHLCDSTVFHGHPCSTVAHSILSCGLSFIPLPPGVSYSVSVSANSLLDYLLEDNPQLVQNSINGALSGAESQLVSIVFEDIPGVKVVYSCSKGLISSWNTIPDCWYYLRGEYPFIDTAMSMLKKGLDFWDYSLNMVERFLGDSLLGPVGGVGLRMLNAPRHLFNNFVSDFVDSQLDMELPEYQIGQITLQKQDRLVEVYGTTLGDVTPDDIRMLCTRWNNSVDYWNQGYYYYSDLPSTYDHNCIMFDNIDFDAAIDAENYAVSLGFNHPFVMYNSAVEMLNDFAQDYMANHTSTSVCASVTVQFSQKMTMTREAFEGTLTINNGHESEPMQNIDVDFVIKDENGVDCTNLFQINFLSYNNMTGTNGDASLDAQNTGSIVVQFIPTKQAAPEIAKRYAFGGSFSFIDPFTGESMTYNLYPVDIMVHPSPDLYVNYFMQRDILGDDPLTEDRIEPIIPAELGVIIHNRGAGIAKNVLLETAEPRIIDNDKGLAVDFAMYGAAFNGQERQLGLMEIPFGNIEPNHTGVGEWWFTSTLLGHFVSYEAHVIHNNSFGNPDLSLVSSLAIHPLIHTVYAYGNLDDGINDFLVDDNEDIRNYPDSLYFSNGSRTGVATADSIGFDHYVTPMDTIVILALDPSRIGWNYEQTWDPGRGQYKLISCTRNSDQQVIPLSNVWQTHVTLPVGADPIYENKLHIVDTLSNDLPTTYTLVFSLSDIVLEVDTILNVPDSIINSPLSEVTVIFNKPIVDSTFNYQDMTLKCNNGENLLDANMVVERIDSMTYILHMNNYTQQSGLFVLNIQTLDITDAEGYNGYYAEQAQWVQALTRYEDLHDTVCDSTNYVFHGDYLTSSGLYLDTLQNVSNTYDSVVYRLHLTVNYTTTSETIAVACDSYTWNDSIYTQSGDYTQTFTAANSCDSVVTLHLTINYPTYGDTTVVACDSYTWHDSTYTSSGTYQSYLTNAAGCDSIVTLYLTINHPVVEHVEATACENFTWNGTAYTESGEYPITLTSSNGCDSVVTLHLTLFENEDSEFTITTNDPCYTWNDVEYCESGDYTQILETVHGCDSVVTLHLTIGVGIDDYDGANFKVYPNPTSNIVNVEFGMDNGELGDVEIQLYNVYGKLLDVTNVVGANNHSPLRTEIDLSRYANGVYVLKAVADGKTVGVRKVVRQ